MQDLQRFRATLERVLEPVTLLTLALGAACGLVAYISQLGVRATAVIIYALLLVWIMYVWSAKTKDTLHLDIDRKKPRFSRNTRVGNALLVVPVTVILVGTFSITRDAVIPSRVTVTLVNKGDGDLEVDSLLTFRVMVPHLDENTEHAVRAGRIALSVEGRPRPGKLDVRATDSLNCAGEILGREDFLDLYRKGHGLLSLTLKTYPEEGRAEHISYDSICLFSNRGLSRFAAEEPSQGIRLEFESQRKLPELPSFVPEIESSISEDDPQVAVAYTSIDFRVPPSLGIRASKVWSLISSLPTLPQSMVQTTSDNDRALVAESTSFDVASDGTQEIMLKVVGVVRGRDNQLDVLVYLRKRDPTSGIVLDADVEAASDYLSTIVSRLSPHEQ